MDIKRFELRTSQVSESTSSQYTALFCDRLSKINLAINNLLACDAVSPGGYYPVFRKYVLPSPSVSASPRTAAIRKIRAYILARLFLGSLTPKMKITLRSFETSGTTRPMTEHGNPEDLNLHETAVLGAYKFESTIQMRSLAVAGVYR